VYGATDCEHFPTFRPKSYLRRRNWVSVKVSSQKSRVEKLLRHLKSFWAWPPSSAKVSIGLLEATAASKPPQTARTFPAFFFLV
jgi:hypothetical protein